jgi:hypothetical protein
LLKTSLDALVAVARPLDLLAGLHRAPRQRQGSLRVVTGTFDLAQGMARTEDLRIVRARHSIDLSGTLRLADLALGMRGRLLRRRCRARRRAPDSARARDGHPRQSRRRVTPEAARSFAALEPSRLGAKLERALGPDAARELADGLGDLLHKAAPDRR